MNLPLTRCAESRAADRLATCVSAVIVGLDPTLGTLVDADLSKESARLQALVIRQQLQAQRFPIATDVPVKLRSLFR